MPFSLAGQRVFVAGHRGMVGSALVRRLARENCEILTVGRKQIDLRSQTETSAWIAQARPDAVFVAAGTVGGILANDTRPAEFLYDNVMIAANVIEASRRANVKKLVFLGSSCIYPRLAPQPISEDALLSGPLEPTNQWYADCQDCRVENVSREPIGGNMIAITSQRSPPISMARATITISGAATSCRRCSPRRTMRGLRERPRSGFGELENRSGSSCMSMILRMPSYS